MLYLKHHTLDQTDQARVTHKEKAMFALTLFFVAGILLGVIGLRLLSRWETPTDKRPTIFRHHS